MRLPKEYADKLRMAKRRTELSISIVCVIKNGDLRKRREPLNYLFWGLGSNLAPDRDLPVCWYVDPHNLWIAPGEGTASPVAGMALLHLLVKAGTVWKCYRKQWEILALALYDIHRRLQAAQGTCCCRFETGGGRW